MTVEFRHNGAAVEVDDRGRSLLDVLREDLGDRSAKDGCSPQGQCGCCTVLVDGAPRVSCVTPARRVAGRDVVTPAGLDEERRQRWADAFTATGASQCGFCTPGIIVRLEGAVAKAAGEPLGPDEVGRALQAHLCRCTGWQSIVEAAAVVDRLDAGAAATEPAAADRRSSAGIPAGRPVWRPWADRDRDRAEQRARLEGGVAQHVGPEVAVGDAGFADDRAPAGALVAVPDGAGGWAVGETLAEARAAAGKVQGRRTTVEPAPPLAAPDGEWHRVLRTSWVEPAYLETDASWCEPGGEPASPLANGGAFGAKLASPAPAAARELADRHGRAVRVLLAREDCVRVGPKRPPLAAGVRADGTGVVHVVRTPGITEVLAAAAPALEVIEVDAAGPPTSAAIRGAGWAEAAVLRSSLADGPDVVHAPTGGTATASVTPDGRLSIVVACGEPLDEVVLRSYCVGAAHMALGWVTSEALAVDDDGGVHDLTIRSFGIVRAVDMPPVDVVIEASSDPPVNGSDAVFAAVAAAVWRAQGHPPAWPTGTVSLVAPPA